MKATLRPSPSVPPGSSPRRRRPQGKTLRRALLLIAWVMLVSLMATGCKAGDPAGSETAQATVPVYVAEPALPDPPPPPPPPGPDSSLATQEAASAFPEALPAPVEPPTLSKPAEELVHLAQARVGNDVLLAYIEGIDSPFDLGANHIVYLTDLGVPAETIAAMVRQDQILRGLSHIQTSASKRSTQTSEEALAEPEQPAPLITEAQLDEAIAHGTALPASPEESAAPTQVTNNYFYNSLAPYGNWIEMPDYGWCWQPSVALVESDWRPYSNGGRWIWSDYGWYWQSYYSWGWAPFHYGRWHLSSNCGWVWLPGTHWGPAWVTWRYYDGYCGWAPLPPACHYSSSFGFTYYGSRVGFSFGFGLGSHCYSFVPTSCFYTARPWTYRVPHQEVNKFYGDTIIVNNYVHGNNNTIINRGIGTETIASASRNEIRRVRITDAGDLNPNHVVRGDRLSRDGTTLAAYRPNLPEQSTRPPQAISQRQEHRRVQSSALVQSDAVSAARTRASNRSDPRLVNPRQSTALTPSIRSQQSATTTLPSRATTALPARSTATRSPAVTSPPARSPRSEARVTRSEPARPSFSTSAGSATPTRNTYTGNSRTEQRRTAPALSTIPTRPVVSIPPASTSTRAGSISSTEVRRTSPSLSSPPTRSSRFDSPNTRATSSFIPSNRLTPPVSRPLPSTLQPPQRSTRVTPTMRSPSYRPPSSRAVAPSASRSRTTTPRPSYTPPPRSSSRPSVRSTPTRSVPAPSARTPSPSVSRSSPPARSAPSRSLPANRSR